METRTKAGLLAGLTMLTTPVFADEQGSGSVFDNNGSGLSPATLHLLTICDNQVGGPPTKNYCETTAIGGGSVFGDQRSLTVLKTPDQCVVQLFNSSPQERAETLKSIPKNMHPLLVCGSSAYENRLQTGSAEPFKIPESCFTNPALRF
jgi:hypothetical protein